MYYSNVNDSRYCWIGLYKSESNNSYYWLDGNKSTYRNWAPGYPINYNPRHCVRIDNYGEFVDRDCTNNFIYRYVCKGVYILQLFFVNIVFGSH